MVGRFPTVKILGSRVHVASLADVIPLMDKWIQKYRTGSNCRQIVVTGFHGIWAAHKHPDFKAILNSADLWIPDGIAPVWYAQLRGMRSVNRIPGAELMQAFFDLAHAKGHSSFFYGDTEGTLDALGKKLRKTHPGHRIAGVFSPPFRPLTPEEDNDIIKMINDARPDVLWVALGLPKQDTWIFEHKERLNVPLAAGVGAAFRFLTGDVKRVPPWIGDHGFEWVWRFICEPRKLWRRELIDVPRFVFSALLELTGLKQYE